MESLHQRIRDDIEGRIMSGAWPPGTRVPPEHELMAEYGCSRMTVSKALSGLVARGLVARRRRAGSVVAAPRAERAVLEIQDFALEAVRTGKDYRHEILDRSTARLDADTAARTGLPARTKVLLVCTLHRIGGVPEAYEERLINLGAVPDAAEEDFADTPPGAWLLARVPWTDAEHVIHAVNADAALARRLDLAPGAACLVLERRTWQAGIFITEACLTYSGERQRLIGRFSPTGADGAPRPPGRASDA